MPIPVMERSTPEKGAGEVMTADVNINKNKKASDHRRIKIGSHSRGSG